MNAIASPRVRRLRVLAAASLVLVGLAVAGASPARADDPAWSRLAPLVYLHPDDDDLPMAAATFVANSRLRWSHDGGCPDHQLADTGQADAAQLGSGGYSHQEENAVCQHSGAAWTSNQLTRPRQDGDGTSGGEGFFLDLDNTARPGQGTTAPVYYDYAAHGYVTYWFFYGFDDALTSATDHEGDWERVSIRLDAADQPVTVAFFEHSSYCVLPWASVARTADGRPVAYSASGTHASYPTAGTHGLDETAAGPQWQTSANLLPVRSQPWYGFGGAWGEVGETVLTTGPLGPSPFKSPTPSDWSGPSC
ncbi:MAG: hypothetical protein WCA46_00820 [Actinocatenispora sp.]